MIIFDRHLSMEYRLGVGFDLEFPDSAPMISWDVAAEEIHPVLFEGTIIRIPLFLISYGRIYTLEETQR
jgi:hypothetical protein|tara:strand:- start:1299 stop:1505 length:207 start_codon:yes stop_codon:yes gene_type:complete